MKAPTSIQALVQLIDDPDESVFEHVRDQLLKIGSEAIPYLENSWETDYYGLLFQNRIEQIIHDIQFDEVKANLQSWTKSADKDLLKGAIIIAKYQFPGLDENKIHESIQAIRKDIWLELNDHQTAFEQVKIFNRIFFGIHHFHGDNKNFHSPVNSYIHAVLESKKGNPLSLCLIYSIIAQSLDLPIYGVNLPNHFVLAYMDAKHSSFAINQQNEFGVLFYINAFSKGSIFDTNEIKDFLNGLNLHHHREYFEPCSNTAIIKRMLTNLISSFQQVGNAEKVNELKTLRELVS
ncbi:MAG: transglutaminase-like domain-containing protein [Crocinitomicaceae bacterium]|jgi:regulator of sirC expression with transglutaminase-like and TPR domain